MGAAASSRGSLGPGARNGETSCGLGARVSTSPDRFCPRRPMLRDASLPPSFHRQGWAQPLDSMLGGGAGFAFTSLFQVLLLTADLWGCRPTCHLLRSRKLDGSSLGSRACYSLACSCWEPLAPSATCAHPGLSSEDRHIAYLARTRPTGYCAEGLPFRAPCPGVNSWVEAQSLTSAPESHRTILSEYSLNCIISTLEYQFLQLLTHVLALLNPVLPLV